MVLIKLFKQQRSMVVGGEWSEIQIIVPVQVWGFVKESCINGHFRVWGWVSYFTVVFPVAIVPLVSPSPCIPMSILLPEASITLTRVIPCKAVFRYCQWEIALKA